MHISYINSRCSVILITKKMHMRLNVILMLLMPILFCECSFSQQSGKKPEAMETTTAKSKVYSRTDTAKVNLSDEEWKKVLPSDVYNIGRLKGTERPWTSKFEKFHEAGTYYCAACGNALFRSDTNLTAVAAGRVFMNL